MKTESRPKPNLEFERSNPLFQPSRFRYLPLVVLALLVLNLVATCSNSRASRMAAKNQPYIYVQQPDGTAVEAKPADPLFRTEAVVASFAEDWLKLAFTWKGAPEKGKSFVKERAADFPAQFHAASLAIEPGYREAYMDLVAKKYQREFPFTNYITGQTQSYVRTYEEPKVQRVGKGVWDITIVATRTHAAGDSVIAQEIFNYVVRVKAVKPSSRDQKLWGDRDTHLGKVLNAMQRQGLQVTQVNEF
ncbi:hypothetical protein AVDCRST_MAG81-111 [uncultured Synechococcales cyanobacterium]|uniref:Uncharacterized protein n=1 Tax=uncultured Synechococcales cyanobacterium TaxID=1936017 RepID=A0A6J4URU4_9CYAN|nr:hypothetical protein AVDCRST_MAG81-111 [uncultured Synechococcales cyanobacterium]